MIDVVVRAAWAIPIVGPPMPDAWVAMAAGRIAAMGRGPVDESVSRGGSMIVPGPAPPETDLGAVVLLPGLVNAHTHLELSGLRARVQPAASLPAWVRDLMKARGGTEDGTGIAAGVEEAMAFGTAALGDVSNTLRSVAALGERGMPAVVFHELLGFDEAVAAERFEAGRERLRACAAPAAVRLRLAPHAPYSTSAALIRAIATEGRTQAWPPTAIHVAESAEEVAFLATGTGQWARLLSDLGIAHQGWRPPGVSPVRYLDDLGFWQPGTIAVHGVHVSAEDLDLLAARDVTLVTCPRSNAWVGAGQPPVARFAGSGIRVAVGTDSLASVPDLNLFEELRLLRGLAPDVPARTLLAWATINGARALGLDADVGALAPGRSARMIAVRVPPGVVDVEEHLVASVAPADVSWVEDLVGQAVH